MILAYAALAAAILIGVAGQILLKSAADAPTLVAQFMHPRTIVGLGAYGSAAFFYVLALRQIPVSIAFPTVALSYVAVALLGVLVLGESFSMVKGAGLVMICLGVVVLQLG